MPYFYTDQSEEPRDCRGCTYCKKKAKDWHETTKTGLLAHYSPCCDGSGELNRHTLPDVEVFEACAECGPNLIHSDEQVYRIEGCKSEHLGYFYAFGSPDCPWDSDPEGPFTTELEALETARLTLQF